MAVFLSLDFGYNNSMLGKENIAVYYVGFSHAPSFGIQKYANFSRLLLPSDIGRFK